MSQLQVIGNGASRKGKANQHRKSFSIEISKASVSSRYLYNKA